MQTPYRILYATKGWRHRNGWNCKSWSDLVEVKSPSFKGMQGRTRSIRQKMSIYKCGMPKGMEISQRMELQMFGSCEGQEPHEIPSFRGKQGGTRNIRQKKGVKYISQWITSLILFGFRGRFELLETSPQVSI